MDYIKEVFVMAVPESVRKVARPVNTIVEDSGRNTKYRYAVRERARSSMRAEAIPDLRTAGS